MTSQGSQIRSDTGRFSPPDWMTGILGIEYIALICGMFGSAAVIRPAISASRVKSIASVRVNVPLPRSASDRIAEPSVSAVCQSDRPVALSPSTYSTPSARTRRRAMRAHKAQSTTHLALP